MFTWTHIGERRFDWRAFRLQNKILLFFFFYLFNHQNVNSKCNNDAQVWEALVWISTLEKKNPTSSRSISRPAVEGERVVEVKLTKHGLFSPLPNCVPTQTPPPLMVLTNKPSAFLSLIFLQSVRRTQASRSGTCIFVQLYTLYPR